MVQFYIREHGQSNDNWWTVHDDRFPVPTLSTTADNPLTIASFGMIGSTGAFDTAIRAATAREFVRCLGFPDDAGDVAAREVPDQAAVRRSVIPGVQGCKALLAVLAEAIMEWCQQVTDATPLAATAVVAAIPRRSWPERTN